MADLERDSEFEFVSAHWDAPPPAADFHGRVQAAYARERDDAPDWRRWVAAVAVVGLCAFILLNIPHRPRRYQPVPQPHFIVISQGEHP